MSKRARSPNYPYFDFVEAIDKVRMIYEREKMNPASRETIAKAMGYSGISGASSKAVAALNSYQLIDGREDDYRVSQKALAILLAEKDSNDRSIALRECAFSPPLFSSLKERYGENPENLPSDDSLRYYLAQNGYNPDVITSLINSYKKTVTFVTLETKSTYTPISRELTVLAPVIENERPHSQQLYYEEEKTNEVLKFRISKDCNVQISFDGKITRAAIEKLVSYLDLAKDDYDASDNLTQG